MSFWNTSDGALNTDGKFEIGGGEPIPDNTVLHVMASDAGWDEWEGERSLRITWTVIDGQYKNRKIFQKIRVLDADTKKRDRAIRMLAAIDANAGGGLRALGREPEATDLQQHLLHKTMYIKVAVWEMGDKTGNWVKAVSGGGKAPGQVAAPEQVAQAAPAAPAAAGGADDLDSIPF